MAVDLYRFEQAHWLSMVSQSPCRLRLGLPREARVGAIVENMMDRRQDLQTTIWREPGEQRLARIRHAQRG